MTNVGDYHNSSERGFDPRYTGAAPVSPAFYLGRMAEWFKAAVLKTVDGDEPSVGSNPTSPVWVTGMTPKIDLLET